MGRRPTPMPMRRSTTARSQHSRSSAVPRTPKRSADEETRMTYSPYGDRDRGGTRTDVDTEVHDDHDQEDRADDDMAHGASELPANSHDANGHDANGHDASGDDRTAAPCQRDSTN